MNIKRWRYQFYNNLNGPGMVKRVFCHMRTTKVQISTFVVRCLDSTICILAISKVSRFELASVAEQAGLNLTWSKTPEDTFSRDVAQITCTPPQRNGLQSSNTTTNNPSI